MGQLNTYNPIYINVGYVGCCRVPLQSEDAVLKVWAIPLWSQDHVKIVLKHLYFYLQIHIAGVFEKKCHGICY